MRTRIVAAITAVTAVGLLAVGMAVYVVERQTSLDEIDVRLHANLESARFIVADGELDGTPWATSAAALRAVVERMSPDDNTGAMGMEGGRITMVPGVRLDVDLSGAREFAAFIDARIAEGSPIIGTYAEEGHLWRYLAAPIDVSGSPETERVTFVMVYDISAELAQFEATAMIFLVASVIALAVIAATGTIVATRLLRPLRQMRETATRVSAQSLQERIPVVGRDDVAELSTTMNAMLDRIDEAVESQRQLLSDVGHELKTPLTIVRGHLEVMDAADAADAEETRELVLDELDRMARLVQDLADAASLHGPSPVQLAPVDIPDLVEQICRKADGLVGAVVERDAVAPGVAQLDERRITQAMLQLAHNAVTHGDGRLAIGADIASGHVSLHVRDHGPGVPDDEKATVFERFHRGAGADVPGSGLGLHIVQVIARAHGGTVEVRDADGGGALFIMRLPVGAAPTEGV